MLSDDVRVVQDIFLTKVYLLFALLIISCTIRKVQSVLYSLPFQFTSTLQNGSEL